MGRFAFYCNLFWLLFSLFTCAEALRLGLGSINQHGPGFFPFSTGLVMFILSSAGLLQEGAYGRS